MSQQLQGKVAFVTGGSRGIGAAIARELAAQGADVALTYARSEQKAHAVASELRALGRRAVAINADSADAEALRAAVERTVRELGGLDILVNSAGITLATPIEQASVAEIDNLWAIHARAPVVTMQAALPHLKPGSRIINIGSNLAERVAFPGITLYSMTKSALLSLTRGLARDLGGRGITVNLVNPGSTDTDMNPADGPTADGQRALTALGRFSEPEDIAQAVSFLAGPGARNITGTVLTVDGGSNA